MSLDSDSLKVALGSLYAGKWSGVGSAGGFRSFSGSEVAEGKAVAMC